VANDADRALEAADRALAIRDRSVHALGERLRRAGVGDEAVHETVDLLVGTGLLDDVRLALRLAERLAERGLGDAAILSRLEAEGLEPDVRALALAELEPEGRRAVELAARESGRGPRRLFDLLVRRGFGEESVEEALASLDGPGRPAVP
jgi:SOS response regulatory protein OraA/RecX